jgi:hypothetical protein
MSSAQLCANEAVCLIHANSFVSRLGTRQVAHMRVEDFIPSKYYLCRQFFVPHGVEHLQYRSDLINACKDISDASELLLLHQLVETLISTGSVISDQIIGVEDCLQQIELNHFAFRTPRTGRSILLNPESEIHLLCQHTYRVNLNRDSSGRWHGYDLYMHGYLQDYNIAIQQDALEFTSVYLEPELKLQYLDDDPERQIESKTAVYEGYSVRCRSWESQGGTQVQLDCMTQITRIEPQHCYLIPAKSFV